MADHVHYWGWAPEGHARRCGATEGDSTSYVQQVTCPACITALKAQAQEFMLPGCQLRDEESTEGEQ